ncbi:uncharacterized protein LOC130895412 [Diorhabda carinulata]|uniref:uncharacterized protein LOC130895412 n=1 Tax=Diorhabda carinulata TaxID=1163345 RepID=UPI0025A1B38C|nr:uncharacterized protein LOC130895412 [Diorhabda carinulata]
MSGEIEVPETPNWLQELEAKREKRVKARLGHEAGAGAPCLKCGDNCPGLDLHFWRKCCKICKCSKEEHEVQDDDIYGWAQFQLLGSKPNKIKRKIVLPGKKDEIDLEWAPKGHNDTVDKYLKTLPPEQLPVKGSQAAQDRKQLLQKQIPIHDIDPTLCHELTEDELKKMNDYIAHVKQSSVGVGQIVSLSSIIKGKLHMLNPAEAAILSNRYSKGVPMSEIVKLQAQNKSGSLSHSLENMSLKNKNLPSVNPSYINQTEDNLNPINCIKMLDKDYPFYSTDTKTSMPNAQFSASLGPKQFKTSIPTQSNIDPNIDPRYLQNTNFDPKNRPSHFVHPTSQFNRDIHMNKLPLKIPLDYNSENSAFVPYQKVSSVTKSGTPHLEDNISTAPNYTKNLPSNQNKSVIGMNPNYQELGNDEQMYENLQSLKSGSNLPNYAPGKYNTYAETQSPTRIPKNVKDLALSTYGSTQSDPGGMEKQGNGFHLGKYRQPGSYPDSMLTNSNGFRPIDVGNDGNSNLSASPFQHNPVYTTSGDIANSKFEHTNPNYHSSNSSIGKHGVNPSYSLQLKPNTRPASNPSTLSHTNPDLKSSEFSVPNVQQYDPKFYSDATPNSLVLDNKQFDPTSLDALKSNPKQGGITSLNMRHGGTLEGSGFNIPQYDVNNPDTFHINPDDSKVQNPRNLDALKSHSKQSGITSPNMHHGGILEGSGFNIPQYDVNNANQFHTNPDDSRVQNTQFHPQSYPKSISGGLHNLQFDQQNENSFNNPSGKQVVSPNFKYGNNEGRNIGSNFAIPRFDEDTCNNNTTQGRSLNNSPLKQGKKLSELHPSDLRIDEDFLNPSHVNIGLIRDVQYPDIKTAMHEVGDFYEEYSPDSIKEILNNVILPDCHYCKKPFKENEFAVTIDRADVLFHAGCFKCAGCNQILADNVYFYNKETDNVYCLRDYAKIRGFPRCKACDELIFTKEYCLAENSTFHLKHFCCTECDMPLAGQDYTLEDEMPYCLPCFEQNKASKCNACGKVIKPDEIGCTLKGVHFHADDKCFACKVCKTPLMGKKLLLRNDKLYCSHDCYGADQ